METRDQCKRGRETAHTRIPFYCHHEDDSLHAAASLRALPQLIHSIIRSFMGSSDRGRFYLTSRWCLREYRGHTEAVMLRSFYEAGDAWEERQREVTPAWWPTQVALSRLLESMPALKKLYVAPYKLGLLALEKALRNGCCRGVQKLVLSPHRYESRMPVVTSTKTSWSRGWRGDQCLRRVLEGNLLPSLLKLVLSVEEAAVLTAFGHALGTGACPSLREVDLVGRLDSNEAMAALGDGLTARGAGCSRWRRLRLHSQVRRLGAGVPSILESPSCSQLEELGIEALFISTVDWAAVCSLLGSTRAARMTGLSFVSWGVRGHVVPLDPAKVGTAMATNSKAFSKLEGLCLGGCCFQPSEVAALCAAIADNGLWKQLKQLELRSRTLMSRVDRIRLLSALKHCPVLEDFRISRSFDEVPGPGHDDDLDNEDENEIPQPMQEAQDDGMGQAIQALSGIKALKILSLSPVRQPDMHALLTLLQARAAAGLTTPRLSFGTLRDATLTPLAEGLGDLPESLKLIALTFGYTRGDQGLQRVARCLHREGLASLQSLMLHGYVMKRETAARFVHSIVTGACPQLTYLGLADVTDPGGALPDSTEGRRADAMSRAIASLFRGERPACAKTLSEVTLRGLQPRDLAAIGRAFAMPTSLRLHTLMLDASEVPWEEAVLPNCLGDAEVRALVQGFRCRHGSTALVELGLSFQRVTKEGAAALAAMVAEGCLPEIRKITLGGHEKGWPVLGRALMKHRDMVKGGVGGC